MNRPKHYQDIYKLYIRRSDKARTLVDQKTGRSVPIARITALTKIEGVVITPVNRIGVYLMDEEIAVVDELPEAS